MARTESTKKRARRMRGDDSLIEVKTGRKKGKWIARVYYHEGGKRKSSQREANSASEAKRFFAELRAQRDNGTLQKDRTTLSGYFNAWLMMPSKKGKARAANTVYGYKCHFKMHVEPELGNKRVDKVTQSDVVELDIALAAKPSIRQAVFRLMRAIFKTAVDQGLIVASPLAKLKEPKHEAKRWTPLNGEQQVAFVSAVASDWYEALFLTALDGGLREGELFGLRPDDYDLVKRCVTVRRQVIEVGGKITITNALKTQQAYRDVELSSMTIDAVKRHKTRLLAGGLGKSGLMFPSIPRTDYKVGKLTWEIVREARSRTEGTRGFRQLAEEYGVSPATMFYALQGKTWKETQTRNKRFGEPLAKGAFLDRFKRLSKAAGLPDIPFHYLRHTAATRWLQNGIPLQEVRRRLGHKDVETTLKFYAHVMPGYGREAADGFDRMFNGNPTKTGTDRV